MSDCPVVWNMKIQMRAQVLSCMYLSDGESKRELETVGSVLVFGSRLHASALPQTHSVDKVLAACLQTVNLA